MNQENNNFSGGNSGIKEISQMSMGGAGGSPGKRHSLGDGRKLEQYRKPALFATAGILALVLLVLVVKAVSGERYSQKDSEEAVSGEWYSQKDFEKVATFMFNIPLSKKEMNEWKAQWENFYPPQVEGLFTDMVEFMEEMMEEIDEADEETMEMAKMMIKGIKVSDSRMLDEEECEECEDLIEMNYGVSVEIDEGCLVEVRMKSGLAGELGLDDLLEDDFCSIVLVLRSGKYIGPWATTEGELDEVNNLWRDLVWH